MVAIVRFSLLQVLVVAIICPVMADDEEQRRREEMFNDFKYRVSEAKIKFSKESIDGDIYCVFHFPDHQGSNEDEIMRYDNTASVRVFLHQYQEENSDVFFFSTNRDDLVVDPERDPNKLKPILGSSEPPYPTNTKDPLYMQRRNHWKNRFGWELFEAVEKGGESLGDIYYRWFHIDSGRFSKKHPDPIRTENTEAVRKVLKEEKIRHPHEFFFSCDKEDLTVDMSNPTLPPRMGSLFPKDYSADLNEIITDPPVNEEGFNEIMGDLNSMPGVIGEGVQLIRSEANNALVTPMEVLDEPLDDEGNAMVDDIDEDDEHQDEEAHEQPVAVMMAMKEANIDHNGDDQIDDTAKDEEQKRQNQIVEQFQIKIKEDKEWKELIDGDIYCVFHFPGHQGSNEKEIMRFDNRPSVRVSIYRYQQQHSDVFYYSTDRNDLVVDPSKDPTKLKPKTGSYAPPAPTDTKSYAYITHRNNWKAKFNRLLLEAEGKGGETLGIIYFRWFHINSRRHSLKYPNPEQRNSTAAIRNLFEEEHVRHPHEFFYSCDPIDLDVDPENPTRPPRLGSLYPPTHQSQADASLDHGSTGEPRTSAPPTISEPLGSLALIHQSPHALGAPVPSVYLSSSSDVVIPELILPPTALITTTAVSTMTANSGIDDPQPDALNLAMIEADLGQFEFYPENPEKQMGEDGDGSGNGASGIAPLTLIPTTGLSQENPSQYLITFYPSEVGNDATLITPVTASLPASLQYMLGSSTDPGMESVVPAPTNYGIHPSSSSLQETHSLDDEMENSSESDIESFSDEENVGIPEDLNQYNVPSNDLYNVQQHEEVEDVEMMDVLDDIIGLEEDFGVANDGVMPDENQILADLHNIAEQEGDAEMLGNALMMGMMGADYNPYDFPPDDEEEH